MHKFKNKTLIKNRIKFLMRKKFLIIKNLIKMQKITRNLSNKFILEKLSMMKKFKNNLKVKKIKKIILRNKIKK
jgi:hypothetical protein